MKKDTPFEAVLTGKNCDSWYLRCPNCKGN